MTTSSSGAGRGAPSVRLRVSYRTPAGLLGEFTRSVGQGDVALEARRAVPVGTRFVFEMSAEGVEAPVEVLGEVVQVTPRPGGRYLLRVRYEAPAERAGLTAVLQHVFQAHAYEKARRHPRVPLHVRATEELPFSPAYLVRDVSRGGVGLEVEAPTLPPRIRVGQPFLLELSLSLGSLSLHGEVVWTHSPGPEALAAPGFGVHFGTLRPDTVERLEKLVSLEQLPPAPWRARVSFGMDAVGRMPGA